MRAMAGVLIVMFLTFLSASSCQAQGPHIEIPVRENTTLFEESEFRRVCTLQGVTDSTGVLLVWERDGVFIDSLEGAQQLVLRVSPVQLVDAGHYTCRAELPNQPNLAPVSAGVLSVLSRADIDAPPVQVATEGSSTMLQCSYPNGFSTWTRDGAEASASFPAVTTADEGVYVCDIYLSELSISTQVSIMLYVVVPVTIVQTSQPVHQNLTMNQRVTFSVDFTGRQPHNFEVRWSKDGQALQDGDSGDLHIQTSFASSLSRGSTSLTFPLARRTDAGLYHVIISSHVGSEGETPAFSSQEEVSFQMDITVRPTVPADVRVDQLSSKTARVSWRLTHTTPDQSANELILRVTFANQSLADERRVSGSSTSLSLSDLVPAQSYLVLLTAVNSDGEATTNPVAFETLVGRPAVAGVQAQRVNETGFSLGVQLMYTGGGAITDIDVSYRPISAPSALPIGINSFQQDSNGLSVTVTFDLSDPEHGGVAAQELEFTIVVSNEFNFRSIPHSHTVPAHMVSTDPQTTPASMSTPATKTELLPTWLIAVIVSVGTIVIMVFIVATVIILCMKCRHSRKPLKYTVDRQSMSTLNTSENSMTTHKPSTSSAAEQYRARQQSSSEPNIAGGVESYRARSQSSTASVSYTPTLDLEDRQHYMGMGMPRKHRRELSESSIGKGTITPSTTASNSPLSFAKNHLMNSHDKSLDCIAEREGTHSDDSETESERQQQMIKHRQKMNMMNCRLERGHADGSVCGSSHQSLVSSVAPPPTILPPQHIHAVRRADIEMSHTHSTRRADVKMSHTHSDDTEIGHVHSVRTAEVEYGYSDGESVASTTASYSNLSMPSTIKPFRPLQYRSPTPYYQKTEESAV